jgi:hypothetical protein
VTVISLFALVLLADIVVVLLYGNYRNLFEENGVEVSFVPEAAGVGNPSTGLAAHEVKQGASLTGPDGSVLVEYGADRLAVLAPGKLKMRFRAPDAGSFLELDYAFRDPEPEARCEVAVARVASRYGVDVVRRKVLVSTKKSSATFRHNLADHAGWFELCLRVNVAAARGGFEVALPEIVRD